MPAGFMTLGFRTSALAGLRSFAMSPKRPCKVADQLPKANDASNDICFITFCDRQKQRFSAGLDRMTPQIAAMGPGDRPLLGRQSSGSVPGEKNCPGRCETSRGAGHWCGTLRRPAYVQCCLTKNVRYNNAPGHWEATNGRRRQAAALWERVRESLLPAAEMLQSFSVGVKSC